ncbi:MAG: F0F1 ATP synthase subunit B [Bacteroidales bacterium]|nr:F0F1 ATP synthase subunit B [Bacteroidales bacterium]
MNNPLISPGLGVIVWMLGAFGVLVFILAKFGWPAVLKALNEREKNINESLNAANLAKEEMAQLKAHNDDLLKEAKAERDTMLHNARVASDQIMEEARAKASAEADRIVANATKEIEYKKLEAMHELKNQIATLSIEIAEKLIKTELSDKDRANALVKRELESARL